MSIDQTISALNQAAARVDAPFPLEWRVAPRKPASPLRAQPDESWTTMDKGVFEILSRGRKAWAYAELEFPRRRRGVSLAGTEGRLHIHGWAPFRLWVDGKEAYAETKPWAGTGPIADPWPLTIGPGRRHRLVLAVGPCHTRVGIAGFVAVRSRKCAELAVVMQAAASELRLARFLAGNAKEQARVEQAAGEIDLDALRRGAWTRVADSIARMEQGLQFLSERAKARCVHVIGHTHIDMNWQWTWDDTVRCVRRDFKAIADLMDDYPEVRMTHSQIPTYRVAAEQDPDVFARVRERIAEGRWENAAATWVEGDLHMADGESVARQFLYAADWSEQHLGARSRLAWFPDTFGHPGNLPQLARLGRCEAYFHMRCNPGAFDNLPARYWEGIDGTRILALSVPYNGNLAPDAVAGRVFEAERVGLKNGLHFWGIGDHGGGLPRYQMEMLALYRDRPLMPSIRFSTMGDYCEAMQKEQVALPANRGETYSLFEGCFTTHARVKALNRLGEGTLLTAETLCALAGTDRRGTLKDAWTGILFNHFHDLLDGAAVHAACDDAERQAAACIETAARVASESAAGLVRPKTEGTHLALINPVCFGWSAAVRAAKLPDDVTALQDAEGRVLPAQKLGGSSVFAAQEVPACGTRAYRLLRGGRADCGAPVAVRENGHDWEVETPHAVVRVLKESGAIGSYFDKRLKRELVGYGVDKYMQHVHSTRAELAMNVFQVVDESPNTMSAWLINDVVREESLLRGAEVRFVESGPVFARFDVMHRFRSSRIEEKILIFRDAPRVEFEVKVDWRELGDAERGVPQLKLSFASSLTACRARFEGPFSVTERKADGMEQPTQKWVDVTGDEGGITILNNGRYGCDVLGSRVRMTLLRNAFSPDPETDNGVHEMRFALVPHDTGWQPADAVRAAIQFNRPPLCVRCGKTDDSGPRLDLRGDPSVVCTCLRLAEHSEGFLVRLFESGGVPASASLGLPAGADSVEPVDLLEQPLGKPLSARKGRVELSLRPFEVKTLRIAGSGAWA